MTTINDPHHQVRNVILFKNTSDYYFEFPPSFVEARGPRRIVIRDIVCLFGDTRKPFDFQTNNICLYATFRHGNEEGKNRGAGIGGSDEAILYNSDVRRCAAPRLASHIQTSAGT
jgi:hypothetical protein